MGVIWQTAALSSDIQWFGVDKSPALAALKAGVEAAGNQGLSMRFASYRTLYYQTASWKGKRITNGVDLAAAYADGFQGGNPAQSALTGSIGVWGAGELASAPTQRLLVPRAAVAPPSTDTPRFRAMQEAAIVPPQPSRPVTMGPAVAAVDRSENAVTVDFIAAFPEQDASLEKYNLGTFVLQLRDPSGNISQVGEPLTYDRYNRHAYESTAGIVKFPFAPEMANALDRGQLELVQEGTSSPALVETPLLAETDNRGVYVDQSQSQTITVRLYERGRQLEEVVQVLVAQYDNGGNLITDSSKFFVNVSGPSGDPKMGNAC
jgi:hypothetical protein